ncbi:IucA/IucC family protein [Bacillus sp. KH172YL63]|uniref:IucA/IucC family protein n=1 Tax=Bacillus sp. KH172YL63 TaxID=2709784 RepID=UPI0013E4F848|nr:IucA/IucC family protein [Bacillus sp. KH172YL63]BCB03733.1 siderophore biosynthesis protein, IucA/IucC family [Bacillus sp. KH172YL63]
MSLYNHPQSTDHLLEEEKRCLNYLEENQPHLVGHFRAHIKTGRMAILHKLAASLLREDVQSLYSDSVQLKKIGSVYVTSLLKVYKKWEPFLHQLQSLNLKEGISYRMKSFGEYVILFPIKDELAFQRVTLAGDILVISQDSHRIVNTANELLSLLGLSEAGQGLADELDNGTANQTLGYAAHSFWKEELKKDSNGRSIRSTLDYIRIKKGEQSTWSPLAFFEQLSLEGHHLHPGSKTKTGMSPGDVLRYSPEFHQHFDICFVAVDKEYMENTEIESGIIEGTFSSIMPQYESFMIERGIDPRGYQLLPVHEWQYQHALHSLYRDEIKKGIVIPIDALCVQCGATSSFRTVIPANRPDRFIKLAVNSQMTSTVRSISSQTALNSTVFTDMMDIILEREPALSNFLPLNEIAGYTFKSERNEQRRNLTVVIRENREDELEHEVMVTGNSLYAISPFSEKTILAELLDEYCHHRGVPNREGAKLFFKDYVSITLPGVLTLLTKYGVALESHLQNSVPVFKNGKPVRFYFRDWGGARIYKPRLEAQGIFPAFYPGSITMTNKKDEMYAKAHYTFFQSHLGEIIRLLVEETGVNESEFWQIVRDDCEQIFSSLSMTVPLNVEEDRAYIYQGEVSHKALTKMRMMPSSGYLYSPVPNPLSKEADTK